LSLRVALGLLLCASVALATTSGSAPNTNSGIGDGGPAVEAAINGPSQIALDDQGNLYILEVVGSRIRRVDAKTGTIQTVVDDGHSNRLFTPFGFTVDGQGNIYEEYLNGQIDRIAATTGIRTTVVSAPEGEGVDTPRTSPSLPKYERAFGLAVDATGSLYAVGGTYGKIYVISHGSIAVFAGLGGHGYNGDGKTGAETQFDRPWGIAFDSTGNLFIADSGNCRIRKVDKASSSVSTVAGTGQCGSSGDGGKATGATLDGPLTIALDRAGNIYFADRAPDCVRRIDAKTSLVSSVPGTCEPKPGRSGGPTGLAVDKDGNLYASEYGSNVVLKVDATTGVVKTIAGNGLPDRIDVLL
jgi:sugar lactone lactonase YvrE